MSKAMRQMPGQPGRASVARGESLRDLASDEACGPSLEHPRTGSVKQLAGTGGLLEAALTRQNLQAAWKRVKANKGAAGVDGLSIEQTAQLLRQSCPDIRPALYTLAKIAAPLCRSRSSHGLSLDVFQKFKPC